MSFWHVIRVVRARKWSILALVAVTLLAILIAAPNPKTIYEASVYMSPTAQVMQGGAGVSRGGETQNREVVLSNLVALAQGADVYQRALDFLAMPVSEQRKQTSDLPGYKQITRLESKPGRVMSYTDWADTIEVAPLVNESIGEKGTTTDIICITVKMADKDRAPFVANAVGKAFADTFADKSRQDSRNYAKFLEATRRQVKTKLRDLQQQISASKGRHQVVEVDSQIKTAIAVLASAGAERDSAQADVREAQAALRDVNNQLMSQPLVSQVKLPSNMNPTVKKLKDELADAEANLRALSLRYKPEHDLYKVAQAHINILKDRIAKEGSTFKVPSINEVHQDLVKKHSEAEYALAKAGARLNAAQASYNAAQARINSLGQMEPRITELMRDYTLTEKNYNDISDKYNQVMIAEQEFTKTGSVIPLGWARDAVGPKIEGPTKPALLVYGLILSLVVGIVVVVWLDTIDNRMRNAADVEQLLQLPVIGLTPTLTVRDGVLPKLTHLYPLSAMAESYKILRTNVLFSLRDKPFKTLMAATGRPGQGATTTVCNLAIALAQLGKRIILIDADMRRPSLHKFFGVSNEAGLSTLLQGSGNLTDAFQKTDIDNLIVLPAGPRPVNPSELLGSNRMQEIVEKLEAHCDLVLFDSPSMVVFSDGPMLASWVDAVVMVVSANQVPRGTEVQTRDLLRRANANIIGVVVNRMSPDNVDSCYFHAQYYSEDGAKQSRQALSAVTDRVKHRDQSSVLAIADRELHERVAAESGIMEEASPVDDEDNPLPD